MCFVITSDNPSKLRSLNISTRNSRCGSSICSNVQSPLCLSIKTNLCRLSSFGTSDSIQYLQWIDDHDIRLRSVDAAGSVASVVWIQWNPASSLSRIARPYLRDHRRWECLLGVCLWTETDWTQQYLSILCDIQIIHWMLTAHRLNEYGQLGRGDTVNLYSPPGTAISLPTGFEVALTTGGRRCHGHLSLLQSFSANIKWIINTHKCCSDIPVLYPWMERWHVGDGYVLISLSLISSHFVIDYPSEWIWCTRYREHWECRWWSQWNGWLFTNY